MPILLDIQSCDTFLGHLESLDSLDMEILYGV